MADSLPESATEMCGKQQKRTLQRSLTKDREKAEVGMASRWAVRIACVVALVFVILATERGVAQEPPQTTNDALHAMSQLAGVIFTGQVIGVRRLDGVDGATGVVEITFAVEDAVRGVSGSTYTLREWAGLWPAGEEPFRVGQQFLMLLHAPGAAGLSSPVGGMDGAIPIRGSAQTQTTASAETVSAETVSPGTVSAASTSADGRVADLRWVATRVVRPLSYKTTPAAHSDALTLSAGADAANDGPPNAVQASASQSTAYTTVLGMLRSWEKADRATR